MNIIIKMIDVIEYVHRSTLNNINNLNTAQKRIDLELRYIVWLVLKLLHCIVILLTKLKLMLHTNHTNPRQIMALRYLSHAYSPDVYEA